MITKTHSILFILKVKIIVPTNATIKINCIKKFSKNQYSKKHNIDTKKQIKFQK